MKNPVSLDSLCAALAQSMGVTPPEHAAPANEALSSYVEEKLGGGRVDRIFMYNPDAVAQWIYEKYPSLIREVEEHTELSVPMACEMPSVTPVCFGTMYTGAQPSVHGIQKYEKPVIRIDSLFDAMIRAGKRCAIVAHKKCSMGAIFLERNMDYYLYSSWAEVNAKGVELILKDEYDLLIVYNGNYDAAMHKYAPEGLEALCELRANAEAFGMFSELIREHWKGHDTLVGFAMDHGCHEIDDGCGSHGLDMDEDVNILHRYMIYPKA